MRYSARPDAPRAAESQPALLSALANQNVIRRLKSGIDGSGADTPAERCAQPKRRARRTSTSARACAEAYAPNPPSMLAISTIAHIRLRTGVSHRCAGKARLCCQCKQCDKGRCADQRGSAKRLRREQKAISPFQK